MKTLHDNFLSCFLFRIILSYYVMLRFLDNPVTKTCNLVSSRNSMSICQAKPDRSPEAPHRLQLMEKILDSVLRLNFRLPRRKGKYLISYSFVPESKLFIYYLFWAVFYWNPMVHICACKQLYFLITPFYRVIVSFGNARGFSLKNIKCFAMWFIIIM